MDSGAHHLRVDAAALLGAGALPYRGLSALGPADAAHYAWPAPYAAADFSLHHRVGGNDVIAVRHQDECWFYLVSAALLGAGFLNLAWKIWRSYSDAIARRTFTYSIAYLGMLFAALLVDHYLPVSL